MLRGLAYVLNVPSQEFAFEAAFRRAVPILTGARGYITHELRRSIEQTSCYILLVQWQTLEDHTVGFRTSPQYQEWKALLHHFYDPFPTVEHYEMPFL